LQFHGEAPFVKIEIKIALNLPDPAQKKISLFEFCYAKIYDKTKRNVLQRACDGVAKIFRDDNSVASKAKFIVLLWKNYPWPAAPRGAAGARAGTIAKFFSPQGPQSAQRKKVKFCVLSLCPLCPLWLSLAAPARLRLMPRYVITGGILINIEHSTGEQKDSLACGTAWRGGRQGRLPE